MSNSELSATTISKFLAWCYSPIGMITILIIIAAIGIVTLMAIKENCTTSDLSYRIVRVLFIAGYACFILNFAGSLVAQFIAFIISLFATKWIATTIVIGLTLASYVMAIYLCGRPNLDDVKTVGPSIPFWFIAIFALPVGAYGIYQSGWLVFGALWAELFLYGGADSFLNKYAPWEVSEPQETKSSNESQSETTGKPEKDTSLIGNIVHETSKVIQKIT